MDFNLGQVIKATLPATQTWKVDFNLGQVIKATLPATQTWKVDFNLGQVSNTPSHSDLEGGFQPRSSY